MQTVAAPPPLASDHVDPTWQSEATRRRQERAGEEALEQLRRWDLFVTVAIEDRRVSLDALIARSKRLVERLARRTGQHVTAVIGGDRQRHGAPHAHVVLSFEVEPSRSTLFARCGTMRPRAPRGHRRTTGLAWELRPQTLVGSLVEDVAHEVVGDLGKLDLLVEAYRPGIGAVGYVWRHRETHLLVGCCRGPRGCYRCPTLAPKEVA